MITEYTNITKIRNYFIIVRNKYNMDEWAKKSSNLRSISITLNLGLFTMSQRAADSGSLSSIKSKPAY